MAAWGSAYERIAGFGVAPADFGLKEQVELTRYVVEAARDGVATDEETWPRGYAGPDGRSMPGLTWPMVVYNRIVRRHGRRWSDGVHVAFILETIADILERPADARALAALYETRG